MDTSNKIVEEAALKNTMDDFIRSYIERDKSINFSNWLVERLQKEMPNMPTVLGEKLGADIIEAVAKYDQALDNLNKVIESGQSKEGWLADKVIESCSDIPLGDVGSKLQHVYECFTVANGELMENYSGDNVAIIDTYEVEWNEYSIKDKVLNIGKQAIMSGLGIAAVTIKSNIEIVKADEDAGGLIGQALKNGIETTSREMKAVVAGAIKTAAAKHVTDMLPVDTPVETICDIAGVVVESSEALFSVATGDSTIVEALEKIGRASIVAASRLCADALVKTLNTIPVVGSIVALFVGDLLKHLESPKFTENVFTVVREVAHATWERLSQTSSGIINGIKDIIHS